MKPLDYLTIYAAVLSTVLAVPAILDMIRNYLKPLRFICRSYYTYDLKKGKEMEVLNLFDITIVNRSKEELYLSKTEFELKTRNDKGLLTHASHMVNVDFSNKLSPGQTLREYGKLTDDHSNLSEEKIKDIKSFDLFRIKVQSSLGKTYKSKWYKHNMIYNEKTVIWSKLDDLEEYNSMLDGAIT
ncbi:MAG: hypothetical protein GC181_14280 [Bacteroidetes bacterium]|nr:hypothetical protein [Bacteroidota bacterium]